MADKKISQLTGATTPLAGAEVLPIVQSGSTVKVSVDNLTAGKSVSAKDVTATSSSATPFLKAYNTTPANNSTAEVQLITANSFSGLSTCYIKNESQNGGNSNADLLFGVNSTGGGAAYEAARLKGVGGDFQVKLGNVVMSTAGKGIDFTANGGDVLTQYDEGTWNPTVGSGSGTITSYTATGTYTRVGRQVTLAGEITITNNGTGASDIRISGLPFAAASVNFAGVGVNGASGATVGVTFAATNTLIMFKYDGTYPVATGQQILFNVTYFV